MDTQDNQPTATPDKLTRTRIARRPAQGSGNVAIRGNANLPHSSNSSILPIPSKSLKRLRMTKTEQLALARTVRNKDNPTRHGKKRNEQNERKARLIQSLLLAQMDQKEIAKVACVDILTVVAANKRLQKLTLAEGNSVLLALLRKEFVGIFDRHQIVTNEILAQYTKLAVERQGLESKRPGSAVVGAQGDSTPINTLSTVGALDAAMTDAYGPPVSIPTTTHSKGRPHKQLSLRAQIDAIDARILVLGKQLAANDDQFIQTVARVGVPESTTGDTKGGSPPPPSSEFVVWG